jgi:hypothetical protein
MDATRLHYSVLTSGGGSIPPRPTDTTPRH